MNIAIDGPAGAGKSTVAKAVAKQIGGIYIDTGAMYRAMALYLIDSGVDMASDTEISKHCVDAKISIKYIDDEQVVMLKDKNVNQLIRTEEVGNMASVVSANPTVRAVLLDTQRELAKRYTAVMDGRDIGSCILPEADLKIYLSASEEVRARRRCMQLESKGEIVDFDSILSDIRERDYRDMNREHSPLTIACGAVILDSSDMSEDEVIDTILEMVNNI